jgi:hypothetical protein
MWFLNSLARRTLSRYALFNAYAITLGRFQYAALCFWANPVIVAVKGVGYGSRGDAQHLGEHAPCNLGAGIVVTHRQNLSVVVYQKKSNVKLLHY